MKVFKSTGALKSVGLALAAMALVTTSAGAAEPGSTKAVGAGWRDGQIQQRDLLDSLQNLLNPSRAGRAGESDEATATEGDNGNTDENTPTGDVESTTPTRTSTRETTSRTTSSSSSTSTNDSSSDTGNNSDSSATSRRTTTTDETTTPSDSSTDGSETATSDSETSKETSATEPTSSPEPTSDTSSFVMVTVTRPNTVITTSVERPTIDDANGDKADVGRSSNLTTIIVAPVVTSVALLFCAVMLFMYIRRRNRSKYANDDVFAKGARENSTSPFIPQRHGSGDGYVKDEDSPHYAAASAAEPVPTSYGARPGDYYVANSADDALLLSNPRYQQQQQAPVRPNYHPPILSTAPTAAPVPAPLGNYGTQYQHQQQQPPQQQQHGNRYSYQPPNNDFRY
ncbi:hypothetical protein H4217_007266 [Coemansia sp. RSA 1939]|nr:hypothetical protein H4217_007266 [Coemansia sp. RSA 1939]